MNLDPMLLELLVCPNDHATLTVNETDQTLDCTGCGYRYPVRDDIPVMLLDEAIKPASSS